MKVSSIRVCISKCIPYFVFSKKKSKLNKIAENSWKLTNYLEINIRRSKKNQKNAGRITNINVERNCSLVRI